MDKKNVQNWVSENTLTEKKNPRDIEILWCQFNPDIFIYEYIFFKYFCEKDFRDFLLAYIKENG
jgi:hypothetical protein